MLTCISLCIQFTNYCYNHIISNKNNTYIHTILHTIYTIHICVIQNSIYMCIYILTRIYAYKYTFIESLYSYITHFPLFPPYFRLKCALAPPPAMSLE